MRISDWSSDVCSSDLVAAVRIEVTNRDGRSLGSAGVGDADAVAALKHAGTMSAEVLGSGQLPSGEAAGQPGKWIRVSAPHPPGAAAPAWRELRAPIRSPEGDRKGVWEGRGVAVLVAPGGRRAT